MLPALILLTVTAAGVYDIFRRRIPNWLVVLLVAVSLGWHAAVGGFAGFWLSAAGAVVGAAVLVPVFLLRGIGAGDVKLLGAVGAAVTLTNVLTVFVLCAILAGVMALFRALISGAVRQVFVRSAALVCRLLSGNLSPDPVLNIDNKDVLSIPFAVPVALATWMFVLFGAK